GAGLALLQRLTKQYEFVYSIGGSEHTRKALPRFGFTRVGEAMTLARPLRPWRQLAARPKDDWRLPARFARNLWWAASPARKPPPGWSVTPVALGQADAGDLP